MKTFVNFTLAILLLIAFIGSGAFFVIISQDLKLERLAEETTSAAPEESEKPTDE